MGEWLCLPPHDFAADLLGCGSLPPIYYPNGLRLSQRPLMWPRSYLQGANCALWRRTLPHPHSPADVCVSETGKSVAKGCFFLWNNLVISRMIIYLNIHCTLQKAGHSAAPNNTDKLPCHLFPQSLRCDMNWLVAGWWLRKAANPSQREPGIFFLVILVL